MINKDYFNMTDKHIKNKDYFNMTETHYKLGLF
jgi:hypothetical protein